MESKVHNRTPMTCPICFKIENILGTHLRRKCLKYASDAEVKATLEMAKRNLSKVASKGLAINYKEVAALLCNGTCLKNMIAFLKNRGFYIHNIPAMQSQLESGKTKEDRSLQKNMECVRNEIGAQKEPEMAIGQPKSQLESGKTKEDRSLQKNMECVRNEIGAQKEPEMAIGQPKSFEGPAQQPVGAIISDLVDSEQDKELGEQNQGDREEQGQEEEEEEEVGEGEGEEKENEATVEVKRNISWKNPLRKKMAEEGMYKRHSLKKEPISSFASHLSKTLQIVRYKQDVENVARFLYYMDNERPTLKFLYDIQKTNEYFAKLLEIGNTHQTTFNYMKSLKRFVIFLMHSTNLRNKDKDAYDTAEYYSNQLKIFQKRLSKGISKENIAKKEICLAAEMKKPTELQSILSIAEPAFKSALKKAETEVELTENENLTIMNYLECLIVLRKLQRPGVVQNLKVDEWKRRNPHLESHVAISVREHKTAANQLAVIVLTSEEEKFFDVYFNRVRPTFLKGKDEIDNFFISSSGKMIHSVSQDITRFHRKFGLQTVTSQVVRRNAETYVSSKCRENNDRHLFSKYLSHSNDTAERVYREKIIADLVKASELPMQCERACEPTTSNTEVSEKPATLPVTRSKEEEFEKFTQKYPVNVEKEPPPQKICLAESAVHGQHLYDRWRRLQNRMRVQYIIGLFQGHRPSEEEVRKCIGLQQWKKNLPRIKDILEQLQKKS